jgi:hypothetical protein
MADVAVGGFTNLLDSESSITMCVGLVIRLSLIYSIIAIVRHSNNNTYGTDLFNLTITQLVFVFIGLMAMARIHPKKFNFPRLILVSIFIAIPFTQMIITIKNGSDHVIDNVDFGLSIASICMAVIYIVF